METLQTDFLKYNKDKCISVPSSYAQAAYATKDRETPNDAPSCSGQLLCPYSANRECPYGEDCEYAHGDICELCGLAVLHPGDIEQREAHKKVKCFFVFFYSVLRPFQAFSLISRRINR